MSKNRDDFSQQTIEIIASRVGYKCCFPTCRCETRGPHTNVEKRISIGVAAHITAASPGGPRYDENLTTEERRSPENGIWMCETHAKLIDTDEEEYPVELLKTWKYIAEYQQKSIINNKFNNNKDVDRVKNGLRNIKSAINNTHKVYEYFKKYYDENFSRFNNNYVKVYNEICEREYLYMPDLNCAYEELKNSLLELANSHKEYELDINKDIINEIDEYIQLTNFTYSSDGNTGFFNDYWAKFFEMIISSYEKRKELIAKINDDIYKSYNNI